MIKSDRIAHVDNIKGFLIVLVVLGHTIQYTVGLDNVVWRYIYSFHMPLFMAVSGYCCYKSHLGWNLITKRAVRLLIPFLVWAIVKSLLLNDITYVWTVIKYPDRGLWFLQTLFWITVIVVLADKCSRNRSAVFFYSIILFVWLLITGVTMGLGVKTFGFPFIGWHLPFFTLGFALKQYKVLEKMNKTAALICLILWCIAGYWCSEELLPINHILYRFAGLIIAFMAILGWLGVFHYSINMNMKMLSFLGRKTLSIYAVTLTTELFLFALIRPYTSVMPYLVEVIALTVFLICFALAVDWLFDKNRYTRMLFLGKD